MRLDEYAAHDMIGLAGLIRSREVTSAELVDCCLGAIEAVNPHINAVIGLVPEDLRAQMGGEGPFAGVPFLIKDIVLHMAGMPNEAGSALCAGLVAGEDSELMARFRRAGLVVVGRSATPEFGYCSTTESRRSGPTRNPWNTDLMAGGSSGGSSAAVAAGVVPAAHANDGGGSIRIPASYTGLVGMKPTRGRTPAGPDYGEPLSGLGIEHAVTRTVRDSAALLDAVQGADAGARNIIMPPARPYLEEITSQPGRLRIRWTDQPWSDIAVDTDVKAALAGAVSLLESLGHEVDHGRPEIDYPAFFKATKIFWTAGVASWIEGAAAATGRTISDETLETSTLACWDYGRGLSALDLLWAEDFMNRVSRSVAPFFVSADILVTPTVGRIAQPIGFLDANRASGWTADEWTDAVFGHAPFTALFNMTGQPAISLPIGTDSRGYPVGIQFVAAWGREDLLYRLAGQLEQASPWIDRRPTVHVANI